MSAPPRFLIAAMVVLVTLAPLAEAYDFPLSATEIREAYFLGRDNNEKTARVLAEYSKLLPMPKRGPHVARIELLTPYAGLVAHARDVKGSYSAQDAEQEYLGQPGTFLLRVRIELTPTYSDVIPKGKGEYSVELRSPDFWRYFSVQLQQDKDLIDPESTTGSPIYALGQGDAQGSRLLGAEIEIDFDAARITSAPVRVVTRTPDGQRVEVEFDLSKLK
jgi:hypothetical protein